MTSSVVTGWPSTATPLRSRHGGTAAPLPRPLAPGGYVVRDATGQALAYLYGRETKSDARQAKVLMNDEARVKL